MCGTRAIGLMAVMLALGWPAGAELQNVEVSGQIRIRGNYFTGPATSDNPNLVNAGLRHPSSPGRTPISSIFSWSDKGTSYSGVEQRTKLGVKADFTDNVSAFVELDSFDIWGEDFRSANYLTGADGRANSSDDLEMYQAYIDADKMFGLPIHLRVGRQELQLGNGFLLGNNDSGKVFFTGLSFDAVHLSYAPIDKLLLGAVWAKAASQPGVEQDGDVDLYAAYAHYEGIENQVLEAYWLYARDARAVADTKGSPIADWVEKQFGVDDYGVTNLHTIALRGAGTFDAFGIGAFDYNAEAAYQFGNADQAGSTFSLASAGFASVYGDDQAKWNTWAGNTEIGYTFNTKFTPRVYAGGVYFGGQDNRKLDAWHTIAAAVYPFYKPRASVSFNRLFSNFEYSNFIDSTDLSNCWIARLGGSAKFFDKLTVNTGLSYFQAVAAFDAPISTLPILRLWTQPNSKDLGWETLVSAKYDYSKDLAFEAGWGHFFTGGGAARGNFSVANGLGFTGGRDGKDADYLYAETKLTF